MFDSIPTYSGYGVVPFNRLYEHKFKKFKKKLKKS